MRSPTERQRAALRVKLEARSIPVPIAGCRLWLGSIGTHGYGAIVDHRGETTTAQRIAWLVHRGPIPRGLFVLHRCDVKCCVEPSHLFLGTDADNHRDKQLKGRAALKLTPDQVRDIRALAVQGRHQREIASLFGIRHATVGRIVRRENWDHV